MFSKPHQGSKRAVAAMRRLRKERETLKALADLYTEGSDGKVRRAGKFVSAAELASVEAQRTESKRIISEISSRLKAMGIRP